MRALPSASMARMRVTSAAVRTRRVSRAVRRARDSLRRVVLVRRRIERGGGRAEGGQAIRAVRAVGVEVGPVADRQGAAGAQDQDVRRTLGQRGAERYRL